MKKIKFLVLDVDGTLTDGKIYMGNEGEVFKAFSVKDGYAIHNILSDNNIIPIIITGRCSQIVENRAKELKINEIHQGVDDKLKKMEEIVLKYSKKIDFSSVAYMGDDLNDIASMNAIKKEGGVVGCPANAVEEVLACADFVASHDGGDGAVRDFICWMIEKKNVD